MSPTKLCEWGDHGLCSGLSAIGPCPCGCHQEPAGLVQGDAKLRGNSGDADATENHNEQEQR